MDEQHVPPPPPTSDPVTPPFDVAPPTAVPSSPLDADQPGGHDQGSGVSRKFVAALVGVGVVAAVTGGAVGASLASTDQDGRHQALTDHTNATAAAPSGDASSDTRVGGPGNGQSSEQAAPGSGDGAQNWSAHRRGFGPAQGAAADPLGVQRGEDPYASSQQGSSQQGSSQQAPSHAQSGAS